MSITKFEPDTKYSYRDYLRWNDDQRWELIDGIPHNMTPAPSTKHQIILRELLVEFAVYLRGKPCEVFGAPFDVRLSASEQNEEIFNVVQPDISVVCDKKKIDEKGCKGAPDLIVEILSPSTAKKDKATKKKLYETYGVKEYWVLDPLNENIEVFVLNEAKYGESQIYGKDDQLKVSIFEDLTIDLDSIFGKE
ncbi:Uma2 family endonuclease [Effusibacillus consociatus]|uniref:Uma2 family endonuclease n=1 Tax=Effusibacillus consociatus TaxID=1117041 RepID=A0ABV9Q618_9BACL